MPRFFFDGCLSGNRATLGAEHAKHMRVLRIGPGDGVTLCDGRGTDYAGLISLLSERDVTIDITSSGPCLSEPCVRCSIYAAYPKSDKAEHIVRKATELGAAEIVFFPSHRCVSKPDSKQGKLERLNKIALSAAEQSERGVIPVVRAETSFEAAVKSAALFEMPLFLYENELETSLSSALNSRKYRSVSIMTGPEGGFEPYEAAAAKEMRCVTLGRRILRCETAPLAALCAVMFHCGSLGG